MNGGPAFPVPERPLSRQALAFGDTQKAAPERADGMTLRDYFAAQAVGAILNLDVNEAPGARPKPGEDGNAAIARVAYGVADAMLAERAK